MTRLIDADYLIKELEDWQADLDDAIAGRQLGVTDAIVITCQMPTVDAVPVRHGNWIKLDMHAHLADHKCTACSQECYVPTCMGDPMYIYCPNCGARMDEADDE